jgi:predicted enzyme related to lactoylglutathione lyase
MFKAGNVTVMVSDFAKGLEWYTKTLGLKTIYSMPPHWAEVGTEGLTIGIHGPKEGESHGSGAGQLSIGLIVEKIENTVAQLQERGISFHGPVQDTEFVKMAFFSDPDGNPLYLCQVNEAACSGEGAEHAKAHEAAAKPAKAPKAKKPAPKAKAKSRK